MDLYWDLTDEKARRESPARFFMKQQAMPKALGSEAFHSLHIRQVMGYPLVAVDTGLLTACQRGGVHIGRPLCD